MVHGVFLPARGPRSNAPKHVDRHQQRTLQSGYSCDRLALAPIGERVLGSLSPRLCPDDTALGGRVLANGHRARELVMGIFSHATLSEPPGSKWCVWNVVAEFHDHHGRRRTAEGTSTRAVEDRSGSNARARGLVQAA